MTTLIRASLFFLLCLFAYQANAFELGVEFSADAVQKMPARPPVIAKMFVSKKAVRTESTMNGNTLIEIVYPQDNRRVLLNLSRKTYLEHNSPDSSDIKTSESKYSPCISVANTTCVKLGEEKINGRGAVKWEMTSQINGQSLRSLHWFDKKHDMPLREQYPNGTVSTMTLLGEERINDRNVEKWKFSAIRLNGQVIESQQWYDSKLKMVIREMIPGGYIRELRNIKVAKQDEKLFVIPSEFKKEIMPGVMAPEKVR